MDRDRHLRDWGSRPPRTPAEVAATRLVARLSPRPRRTFSFLTAAAVAGLLVAVIAVGWLTLRNEEPTYGALDTPPLDDNVVLWWVDPETPVYFVLSPPDCE